MTHSDGSGSIGKQRSVVSYFSMEIPLAIQLLGGCQGVCCPVTIYHVNQRSMLA